MRFIIKIVILTVYFSIVHAKPGSHARSAKKFDEVMMQARSTCTNFNKQKYLEYGRSMEGWGIRRTSDSQFNPALISCISEYMCNNNDHMKDMHSMAILFHKGDEACSLAGDYPLESETPFESNLSAEDSSEDTISEKSIPTNTSITLRISTSNMAWFFIGLISGSAAIYVKANSFSSASSSSKALRRPEL